MRKRVEIDDRWRRPRCGSSPADQRRDADRQDSGQDVLQGLEHLRLSVESSTVKSAQ